MSRTQTALLSFLAVWVLIAGVTIEKSYGADLWDIYQLALIEDQKYRAAIFNHEATRINLPLAKSAFKPSITTSGGVSYQTSADKTTTAGGISLDLNLPLYDKSKRLNITQSEHRVDISSLQLLDAKQQLILRTKAALQRDAPP